MNGKQTPASISWISSRNSDRSSSRLTGAYIAILHLYSIYSHSATSWQPPESNPLLQTDVL